MSSAAELHALYAVGNAPLRPYPFPHFYVEGIFPPDTYARMRHLLPHAGAYTSLADTGRVTPGAYRERGVFFMTDEAMGALEREAAAFWSELRGWLLGDEFMGLLVAKFETFIQRRFEGCEGDVRLVPEAYLVRDRSGYAIGPHTDAPHRLLSLLFYLPPDGRLAAHGTSLYLPGDRSFTCEGGPHYRPEPFERVATMPFAPNALFGFLKTENSFHGVEPVKEPGIERDLILYDIRIEGRIRKVPPRKEAA